MQNTRVVIGLGLAALVAGCGSSSNDQGISFTNLGFYDPDSTTSACEGGRPLVSVNVPLSSEDDGTDSGGGEVRAVVALQNNLSGQFVRLDRATIRYFASGASTQPPATSIAISGLLGPATEDEETDTDSSTGNGGTSGGTTTLPDTVSNANCADFDVPVVPASVVSFVNLNRDAFPELPFVMEVTFVAAGITSAGDRIESNSQTLRVQFTRDLVIEPTPGADEEEGA